MRGSRTSAGESAGVCRRHGAVFLGSVGEVQDQPLLDLMAGLGEPWSDEPLGRQLGEGFADEASRMI